jgi:hypothetical protein
VKRSCSTSAQPGLDLAVGPGPEIQGDDLSRPLAHALAQIFPGDDEVGAAVVLAAQDHVAVRVAAVVMIDRHPIESGAEVFLHLAQETAGEMLEILVLDRVLGRDDEAELVAVAVGPLEEGGAVGPVEPRIVEVAGQALAGNAVALEIAQMGAGAFEASAGQLDDPRLDHDAAAAERGVVVARGEHASDPGAAPDAAAVESAAARACAALAPTLARDHALDLLSEAAEDPAAARADPAELGFEIVVAIHVGASYHQRRRSQGDETAGLQDAAIDIATEQ